MGLFKNLRNRKNKDKKKLSTRREYLLNKDSAFDVTEAFRNLKASLSVSIPAHNGGSIITVTSSYPEDGKTTVTANLALMFANSDAKILLVDADIRKGRIHKYFQAKSTPGLSDYLSGLVSLEDILHVSNVSENLYYIPCGTHSPKPYELLESEKMSQFLEQLRNDFDYIIVDTPPILLVSDAIAVAPKTDGVVLVCRHNLSYVSDLERSVSMLNFAKANILGLVVNDYHAPQGKIYGGYHGYYHYTKYSYAYSYKSSQENMDEDLEENPSEEN